MVRSLWSAASGMIAQQTNVDTIANNLSNVNTTGYKTEVAELISRLQKAAITVVNNTGGVLPLDAKLRGKNTTATKLLKKFPQHFSLLLLEKPRTVTYNAPQEPV